MEFPLENFFQWKYVNFEIILIKCSYSKYKGQMY